MMALFEGCQIVLDLTTSVRFKEKTSLRKAITSHGGVVSFIVTKKSTHVVCNDAEKADISYKCRMGLKYGIPVVSMEFVWQSVATGQLQSTDNFLVAGQSKSEGLKEGKIAAARYQKRDKKKEVKPYVNVGAIKVWQDNDKNCPEFAHNAQLAKFAMFQGEKKVKSREETTFAVLEVHVDETFSNSNSSCRYKYRVVSHTGLLHTTETKYKGSLEFRFCTSVDEALTVYSTLYKEQQQQGMRVVHDVFSRHIGSNIFKQMMGELGLEAGTMSAPVEELVEHVWREAQGELDNILSVPATNIKMEQIEKAEAVLKQLKAAMDNGDQAKIPKLMQDFYSSLPHHKKTTKPDKAWLSRKQDICQLVKDMISVSEATDWSTRSSVQSKYKALRCGIHHLHRTSPEYLSIKQQVLDSLIGDTSMEVRNIFAVNRPVETVNFTSHISPKQMMFHASKADNMVGILSRGLLMPRVVVDDHGGTRSDPGMLGAGIYFASAASTSIGYSLPSLTKGSRFMLVNEVALGNCKDVYSKDLTLTSPPEGYNSVHGVRQSENMSSDFKNDEYVIYNTSQQCIRYLVEFTIPGDIYLPIEDMPSHVTKEEEIEEDFEEDKGISLKDVRDVQDPLTKVKPGLIATGDAVVNLKAVHIRAKLVDLASEVVVLQHYENHSKTAVEAKYVFPLGDMAAVCGFEAFINGKHIVGEVKEKETAHKEYKKAVSEGHGAYLMDQDEETPDVFTVSVGNLPPGACVLIKITYVAELQVEGEMISFRLPGSVAPWQKDSLKDVTQKETETHEVKQGETTLQVAVDMPFDIRSLECSTHTIRMKKTLTKATVELLPDQSITDGFQLLIGLAEIHVPRMWVERKTGYKDHQACMLTFYPQFEACETEDVNVTILVDLSNSMKGDNLVNAKKVVLLTLEHLPASWNFNIIVFGTSFKELFPICVRKTSANVKLASDFVLGLTADLGNTEVIRPMHNFYLLKSESSIQNVFLVSDGHINNEEVMFAAANKNSQHTRLFTMGVSSTANRHALRALSRVGAGAYEYFDAKVKSKWEAKVKAHINKAAQPGLTSVTVDWEQHGADVESPVQAPKQITALFSGSRQVIYGFVQNCTMATLRAMIAGEEVSTLVSTSDLSITQGLILHRLTARAMISDWEDGILAPDRTDHEIVKMNTKDYIINLSTEYSIVTQFTSFVAIEKRDKDEEKRAVDAPSMSELVEKENVDQLGYMGYEEDKAPEVDEEKAIEDILKSIRLNSSSKTRQRDFIEEGLKIAQKIEDRKLWKKKIIDLEAAFDEWGLDDDYDFTSEFSRKRHSLPSKKNIVVIVMTRTGQSIRVPINQLNTVEDLKARLEEKVGIPRFEIQLLFAGHGLEYYRTLEDYDIQNQDRMHLFNRLRGGGPVEKRIMRLSSSTMMKSSPRLSCMKTQGPPANANLPSYAAPLFSSSSETDSDSESDVDSESVAAESVLAASSSSWSDWSEECEEEGRKSKHIKRRDMTSDSSGASLLDIGDSYRERSSSFYGELDSENEESMQESEAMHIKPAKSEQKVLDQQKKSRSARREDEDEEEEEEDDDMGFGLFDDDMDVGSSMGTIKDSMAEAEDYECLDLLETIMPPEKPMMMDVAECLSLAKESFTEKLTVDMEDVDFEDHFNFDVEMKSTPSEVEARMKMKPKRKKKAAPTDARFVDSYAAEHTIHLSHADQKLPMSVAYSSPVLMSESLEQSTAPSVSDQPPPMSGLIPRSSPQSAVMRESCNALVRTNQLSSPNLQRVLEASRREAQMSMPSPHALSRVSTEEDRASPLIQPFGAPMPPHPPPRGLGFSFGGSVPPPPPPGGSGFSFGGSVPPLPSRGSGVSFGAPIPQPPPSPGSGVSFGAPVPQRAPRGGVGFSFGAPRPPPPPSSSICQQTPLPIKSFMFGGKPVLSNVTVEDPFQPQMARTDAIETLTSKSTSLSDSSTCLFGKPVLSGKALSQEPPLTMEAQIAAKMGIKKPRSIGAMPLNKASLTPEVPNARASLLSDIRGSQREAKNVLKQQDEPQRKEKYIFTHDSVQKGSVAHRRSSEVELTLEKDKKEQQKAKQPTVSWRACDTQDLLLNDISRGKALRKAEAPKQRKQGYDVKGSAIQHSLSMRRNVIDDAMEDDDYDSADSDWEEEEREESFSPLLEQTDKHIDVYEEDTPLYKFGIGLKIPSITVSKSKITRSNSHSFVSKLMDDKLLDLPHELQQEMGIDLTICEQLLKQAGLSSLGLKVQQELYPLLKMWIIVLFLFKLYIPEQLPIDCGDVDTVSKLTEEAIHMMIKDGIPALEVMTIFKRCLEINIPLEEKYGYLCNMLELGTSWCQLIGNMFHVHTKQDRRVKIDGGLTNPGHGANYIHGGQLLTIT